jgi:hypothetical protein
VAAREKWIVRSFHPYLRYPNSLELKIAQVTAARSSSRASATARSDSSGDGLRE